MSMSTELCRGTVQETYPAEPQSVAGGIESFVRTVRLEPCSIYLSVRDANLGAVR